MLRGISVRILTNRSCQYLVNRRFSAPVSNIVLGKNIFDHRHYTPTDGYLWHSPYEKTSIPDMTIDQYVWKNVEKWKNHVAIVCGVTGRKYTYAKLRDHCAALAIRLRKEFGLAKDDIVAICLPNIPEFPIALLGSIEAGLVVTTVNPNYTAEEISRQLISSRPKLVFGLVDNFDVLKNACRLAEQPDIKLVMIKTEINQAIQTNQINFMDLINPKGLSLSGSALYNQNADLASMSLLLYSSGTTGLPKGVMLSHSNITSNCEATDVKLPYERLVLPTTSDYQDVLPCVLPFYHCYALVVMLISKLSLGCKIVSIPKYEPNQFLRIIKEHRSTYLCVAPPIIIQLSNHKGAEKSHFEHVRQVMSAASTLAQTDADRFKEKATNAEIFQGYGLTETSPICTLTPRGTNNYGTIGWPVSNIEAKIVSIDDPHSIGLDVKETGELWMRGPNVMKGYYKNEEATNEMVTQDGWLRTGDIGHYDENGLFYISDRMKELIKVNAYQVAPAELEAILRDHPAILDAVVVGIPHPKCGEVPKAFVVKQIGSAISAEELQEFVAKQVVKYKQITGGIHFIESIPKTPTGKILRKDVKKLYC